MQVFVSYRRRDNAHLAEQVRSAIDNRFGEGSAFLDKVNIGAGADYRHELVRAIQGAECMLVLIGPNWQAERLSDPDDPVGFELQIARQAGAVIIPVLHTEEKMPAPSALPGNLRWFADINAFEFVSPQSFNKEIEDLLGLVAARSTTKTAHPAETGEGDQLPQRSDRASSVLDGVPDSATELGTPEPDSVDSNHSERVVLNERYELQQRIGRGGMADVFLARDLLLDRPVAIKVLFPEFAVDPNFVERFRREAQSAANLNHPNIVGVYDWGRYENTYFMAMEYVQGRTLADILRSNGHLNSQQAAEIAVEVAGALSFAHRSGVVHRDIKPANILIGSNGAVKVADFGEPLDPTATYFSPEQAQGAQPDPRSDLYSLGVVLYEMVAGRPPFTGENPVSIAYNQVHENPQPLNRLVADVPKPFEAIVAKLLAKRPEIRYANADEVRDELRRFRNGEPVQALAAIMGTPLPNGTTLGAHNFDIGLLSGLVGELEVDLGPTHPETLTMRQSLAQALVKVGRVEEARAHLAKLLGARMRAFGEKHPATTTARLQYAFVVGLSGEWDEAVTRLEGLLADQTLSPGGGDSEVPLIRSLLARFLAAKGEAEAAIAMYREAATALPSHPGQNDQYAVEARFELAVLLARNGRPDEAIALFNGLLLGLENGEPAPGLDMDQVRRELALALKAVGSFTESAHLLQVLVEERTTALGPQDPLALEDRSLLAAVLADGGDITAAIAEYRALLRDYRQSLGLDHPATLAIRRSLANLLASVGRRGEAINQLKGLLANEVKIYGRCDSRSASTCIDLAVLLSDSGQHVDAIRYLEGLLADFEEQGRDREVPALNLRFQLARILALSLRVAEAKAAYRSFLTIGQEVLPEDDPLIGASKAYLIDLERSVQSFTTVKPSADSRPSKGPWFRRSRS